ncbi:167_t:CDS:2, partial [Entrophospora sp. SA101]
MRIRPLLLGVADNDANALSFLMNHLPDEIFNRMESTKPEDTNAFFTNLKNLWLKRRPSSFNYGNANTDRSTAYIPTASANHTTSYISTTYVSTASTNRSTIHISTAKISTISTKFSSQTEKAKYYEELKNYADMGLEAEDNRVLEPMEIDYAIVNVANKIDQLEGLSTTPNSSINLARDPR